MNKLRVRAIKNISFYEEKKKTLLFFLSLILLIFISYFLLKYSFAKYRSQAKLNASIDRALYIFETQEMTFNLDPNKIIPSDSPYVYNFTISNFKDEDTCDVDIEYTLKIRSTTNLPITIKLYKNENYTNNNSTNLISSFSSSQDEDGAWYRVYPTLGPYQFLYTTRTTDTYTLVVNFPKEYSRNTLYSDSIEDIEVTVNSKQII